MGRGIQMFEIPIVRFVIFGARGLVLAHLTGRVRKLILSEISKKMALGTIVAMGPIVSSGHMDNIEAICKDNLSDIQTFREELIYQVKLDNDISLFTDI